MRVKFFAVPVFDSEEAEKELNSFLGRHRVLAMDRHLVTTGASATWALSVSYLEKASASAPREKRSTIDYKEVLTPEDFELYAGLRALRKAEAERRGIPPYAVFNNSQLAEMVQRGIQTKTELSEIDGVGPARVKEYGELFLKRLHRLRSDESPEEVRS